MSLNVSIKILIAACYSVFSFCLIHCVWGLLFEGWKVVFGEQTAQVPCEVFPDSEIRAYILVDGARSCLSERQHHVQ